MSVEGLRPDLPPEARTGSIYDLGYRRYEGRRLGRRGAFLALYAEPNQLPEVAKSFRIYYKKVEGKTPTSYTMDHSAGSYVYDTQGRLRLYHRYGSGAQALADDLKKLLAN